MCGTVSYPCAMRFPTTYTDLTLKGLVFGEGRMVSALELIGFRLLHGDARADEPLSEPTQREILFN